MWVCVANTFVFHDLHIACGYGWMDGGRERGLAHSFSLALDWEMWWRQQREWSHIHKFSFNIFFPSASALVNERICFHCSNIILVMFAGLLSLFRSGQPVSFIWPMLLLTRSLFIAFHSVIYWPNFMFVTSMRTDKFHRKHVSEPSFFFFFHISSMLPSFCVAYMCFVAMRILAQFFGHT